MRNSRRSLQVRVVKDQDATSANPMFDIDPDKINKIVKESVKTIGIGIVAVVASLTALHTASEIAINAAPKN